jgi:hypothetical protein
METALMTTLFVVATVLRVGLPVFLLVAGVWAYRRFHLPSIPWLLSYVILGPLLALPMADASKRLVDHAAASGLGPIGSSISLGEFVAAVSVTSTALAAVGHALIAWFILSELAFAYHRFEPIETETLPGIVTVPRQHSYVVGFALLACAAAMPLFWLTLLVARA